MQSFTCGLQQLRPPPSSSASTQLSLSGGAQLSWEALEKDPEGSSSQSGRQNVPSLWQEHREAGPGERRPRTKSPVVVQAPSNHVGEAEVPAWGHY